MKIRQGFVSNSSSSSFVALGIDLDKHPKLKEKYWDDESYDEEPKNADELPKNTTCNSYDDVGTILGLHLGGGSTDDGDFGVEELSADELMEYAKEFEKATGVKPKLLGAAILS